MKQDLEHGGLAKFIRIERTGDGQYTARYPSIIFPDKCAVCANPTVGFRRYYVGARKVVSSTYSVPTTYTRYIVVSMEFEIPLCKDHVGVNNIYDQKVLGRQYDKRLKIFLIAAAVLSFIILPLAFSSWIGIPIGIVLSVLAGVLLAKVIKVGKDRKPYFHDEPYTQAYRIDLEDDSNNTSMRVVNHFENDQIWNEFKSLNRIEEHLIAAMNTPISGHSLGNQDIPICENAIRALIQARCETAVPAIIDKFVVNMGQVFDNNNKICNVAAQALETLGIREPLDSQVVEQLLAGLNNMYVRDAVVKVLSLSSVDHLVTGLNNQNVDVRIAVIRALGQTGNEKVVPVLIEHLADKKSSWGTRVDKVAAEALKLIGTPQALAAVEKWKIKPTK